MASFGSSPVYTVPRRKVVAVEHPMAINDVDITMKTFGRGAPLAQILDAEDYDGCLPLFLRPEDPSCPPNLSQNAPTNNVLIKVTIPKRTGRKRKRGSQDPFEYHPDIQEAESDPLDHDDQSPGLLSHSRLDDPKYLQKRLRDCRGYYHIEPVGTIEQTHRYRGLSDFHYSTTHGNYMTKFRNTIMTGDLDKIKQYKLDPSRGPRQMTELIPPPTMTDHPLPFNWGYHQNPTIRVTTDHQTGKKTLINHSTPARLATLYVAHDIPVTPSGPTNPPPDDPLLISVIEELQAALSERPIWTRRAIMNRIGASPGVYLLKPAMQYVGYQFRGGPWRDAIIRYGVDPRTDPKYRFYQTLFFKIYDEVEKVPGQPWTDIRSEYTRRAQVTDVSLDSHIFDGTKLSLDGKIWQVCDITDPMIQRLASTSTLRSTCDLEVNGWYCNGTWAKIKAVMRTKISAIRAGKHVPDEAFETVLKVPDLVEEKAKAGKVSIPMPDLKKVGIKVGESVNGARKKRIRMAARRWKAGGAKIPGLSAVPEGIAVTGDGSTAAEESVETMTEDQSASIYGTEQDYDEEDMMEEDDDEGGHDEDEDEVEVDYDEVESDSDGAGDTGGDDEDERNSPK
ncbi:hypothetical protein V502_08571 [Pseudogymnoascus sp. VKM F-4520 (FW-2644)]|nr:hypothetical protein V502_08571 [Pseudogymnoascus sp. VKM F-4520 (FW-2644)]